MIADNISLDYIKSFITLWGEFKHRLKPTGTKAAQWFKWGEIFRNLQEENYETLTKPFIEVANKNGMLAENSKYKRKCTVTIQLKTGIILLPKQILLFETHYPKNTLLEQLENNPTPMMYERIIEQIAGDLKIELKKSVLRIVKTIQAPTKLTLTGFPTERLLRHSLRFRDIRTIRTGLDFLKQHSILSYINLVDKARIGYKTQLIWHRTLLRDAVPKIKSHVLLSFPLNTEREYVSLIQYPQDPASESELSWFNHSKEISLDFHLTGWHLKEMRGKRIDRWEVVPHVIAGISFCRKVPQIQTGVEFNLDPTVDPYSPSSDERKVMLNIKLQTELEEEIITKKLGIEIEVLRTILRNLYRHKLIMKFPFFNNIGIDGSIHFSIQSSEKNPCPMMENIVNHLRLFPYFDLYGSLNRGIVIGSVNMPAEWVERFLYQLAELQENEQEVRSNHYIGPEVYSTRKIRVKSE